MRLSLYYLVSVPALLLAPFVTTAQKLHPDNSSREKYSDHSVRKATIRSAIIPGWGQAYNKKYWKIPIVYAALGTTGYLFVRNLQQYRDSRDAYILATDADPANDIDIKEPYYSVRLQPQRIKDFRNAVRQNMDYCVLWFIIFWGLNVVDATVDAHLKSFDVGDKLSFNIKPVSDPVSRINGLGIVMRFGK